MIITSSILISLSLITKIIIFHCLCRSTGTRLTEICALYQNISNLQNLESLLEKMLKKDYLKSMITPLPELHFGQFFSF